MGYSFVRQAAEVLFSIIYHLSKLAHYWVDIFPNEITTVTAKATSVG